MKEKRKQKKENKGEKKKIKFQRPRFLTILLAIVMVISLSIDALCIYDLFGGDVRTSAASTAQQEQDDKLTDEQKEAKKEREDEENQKEEAKNNGSVVFDPSVMDELDNTRIGDEDQAFEFLKSIKDEYGIKDVDNEYELKSTDMTQDYVYYNFQQKYNGVEIYGGGLNFQTEKGGGLINVSGKYFPIPDDFNTEPKVYEDIAENAVKLYVQSNYKLSGDSYYVENTGLKIVAADNDYSLCYLFNVSLNSINAVFLSISVDASSGKVVGYNENFSTDMKTLDSDDDSDPLNKKPDGQKAKQTLDVNSVSDEEYVLEDTNRNINIYLMNRNQAIDSDSQINEAQVYSWNPKTSVPDKSCIDTMANLQRVYDFYKNVFMRVGVKNNSDILPVYVGVSQFFGKDLSDNAAMFGNSSMVVGVRDGYEYSADLDVMGHEYTHGVVFDKCGLVKELNVPDGKNAQSTTQYGINEGIADIFGELIDDYCADYSLDNNCDWKNSVRDMTKPYFDDYSEFKEYQTDCHDSSFLVSYPAYCMQKSGKVSNAQIASLYYDIIPNLSSHTDFKAFRSIIEMQAVYMNSKYHDSGVSDSSLDDDGMESVIDSFDKVGIPTSFEKTVVSNGTLKVYGKNDTLYDNYNIKIKRLNRDDTVLDQDVNQKEFKIPSSIHNGIYDVILTDLLDGSISESFTLVINNNAKDQKVDKYPKVCKVYTQFGTVPRDVVLVLDLSGSMEGTPIDQTKQAASKFVDAACLV